VDLIPPQSTVSLRSGLLPRFRVTKPVRFAQHAATPASRSGELDCRQAERLGVLQAAISSLTFDRLAAAAKSVQETSSHSDPTIRQLERQIQTIASQVPQSFALMRAARVHMRALFVSDGVPGFWMTINPADLSCPMVVTLAGVTLSCDELSTETRRIRRLTAQMIPVAVAQFFHHICAGVFDALLAAGKGQDRDPGRRVELLRRRGDQRKRNVALALHDLAFRQPGVFLAP
jgi:Helitron helicase-like domain at N-terminus